MNHRYCYTGAARMVPSRVHGLSLVQPSARSRGESDRWSDRPAFAVPVAVTMRRSGRHRDRILPSPKVSRTVAIMQVERAHVEGSRLAIAAGVLGLVVALGYLVIIYDEAERTSGRVAVVFLFILAVSALALAGGSAFTRSARMTAIVLGAATGGLLTAGVLGIFSIGLPLLIAGVLSAAAWGRSVSSVRPVPVGVPILSTVAAIASGAVLILGIVLT